MSYQADETSVENAQPIECYIFTYGETKYTYTTTYYDQSFNIGGSTFIFNAEYIRRSDSLKQSDSGSSNDNCIITLPRSNPVAMLYQGTPPEQDSIKIEIYRIHGENNEEYTRILRGVVSQVKFSGSDAELTITIENLLTREIPRGKLSYYCQNCIYDSKCGLDRDLFMRTCYKENEDWGLTIISSDLADASSDNYYTDGYLQMGNSFRQIVRHDKNMILIKYPINMDDRQNVFYVYPGCNNLFVECHRKFSNTENFSGIPYQQPFDALRHPITTGVYWINGNIVYRDTNGTIYEASI